MKTFDASEGRKELQKQLTEAWAACALEPGHS